jgi:hypothetical protein
MAVATTHGYFSNDCGSDSEKGLTPLDNRNTRASWPLETKTDEIRLSEKQAALAAEAAREWRRNIESWSEFTQHTTFHGVKYIFDNDNPHKWRR